MNGTQGDAAASRPARRGDNAPPQKNGKKEQTQQAPRQRRKRQEPLEVVGQTEAQAKRSKRVKLSLASPYQKQSFGTNMTPEQEKSLLDALQTCGAQARAAGVPLRRFVVCGVNEVTSALESHQRALFLSSLPRSYSSTPPPLASARRLHPSPRAASSPPPVTEALSASSSASFSSSACSSSSSAPAASPHAAPVEASPLATAAPPSPAESSAGDAREGGGSTAASLRPESGERGATHTESCQNGETAARSATPLAETSEDLQTSGAGRGEREPRAFGEGAARKGHEGTGAQTLEGEAAPAGRPVEAAGAAQEASSAQRTKKAGEKADKGQAEGRLHSEGAECLVAAIGIVHTGLGARIVQHLPLMASLLGVPCLCFRNAGTALCDIFGLPCVAAFAILRAPAPWHSASSSPSSLALLARSTGESSDAPSQDSAVGLRAAIASFLSLSASLSPPSSASSYPFFLPRQVASNSCVAERAVVSLCASPASESPQESAGGEGAGRRRGETRREADNAAETAAAPRPGVSVGSSAVGFHLRSACLATSFCDAIEGEAGSKKTRRALRRKTRRERRKRILKKAQERRAAVSKQASGEMKA